MDQPTKLPPSSPSSPTAAFSVPSAEKVDGFPRRSMRRARQRRSHSSSQFRYQSSQVELTPLPPLKGRPHAPGTMPPSMFSITRLLP
ncbi:serine/threonine-protein phosphatase 2A 56 kDa regulatory subunit beta isoform [Tachysurus ichikawai]